MSPFWFGVRLSLRSGRGTRFSTLVSTIAASVGVAVILFVAAVPTAMDARATRLQDRTAPADRGARDARVLVIDHVDTWQGERISRRLVGLVDPTTPPPPGVTRLPGPGEIVLSPALASASALDPGLRDRLPGRRLDDVSDAGLLDPSELIAYIGVDPSRMDSSRGDVIRTSGFGGRSRPSDEDEIRSNAQIAAALVAGVLLALFTLLIISTTRLAANSRAARIAALRLVGGSISQSRRMLAGEVAVSTTLGTLIGITLFLVGRDRVLTGASTPWFPADFSMGPVAVLALAALLLMAHVTAQLSARSAIVSSHATRRGRPSPMRLAPRALMVAVALVVLAVLAVAPSTVGRSGLAQMMVAAVLVLLVALPAALPAMAALTARWTRPHVSNLGVQLGLARIESEPTRAGRAVVALGAVIIVGAAISAAFSTTNVKALAAERSTNGDQRFLAVALSSGTARAMADQLRDVPGVESAAAIGRVSLVPSDADATSAPLAWVGSCPSVADLLGVDSARCEGHRSVRTTWTRSDGTTSTTCFGSCPSSTTDLVIQGGRDPSPIHLPDATTAFPLVADSILEEASIAAILDPEDQPVLAAQPRAEVLVRTDGQLSSEAQVRDVVLASHPDADVRSLASEQARNELLDVAAARVRDAGYALAAALAIASFVVTSADALLDRPALLASLRAVGAGRGLVWRSMVVFLTIPLIAATLVGATGAQLLTGVTDAYFGRPFTWRPGMLGLAIAPAFIGIALVAVIAWMVVARSSVADAIRRD